MNDYIQPAPEPAAPYEPHPFGHQTSAASAPEAPSESVAAPAKRAAARRSAPRRNERAQLRRAAQFALDLTQMDPDDRDLYAAILGLSAQTSTVDIAASAASATAKDVRAGLDAEELMALDGIEAGITAATLGRARMAAVWRLLSVYSCVSGEMPSSDAKAAIAIGGAIRDNAVHELRPVLSLALKQLVGR